jgi:hypothetical protein
MAKPEKKADMTAFLKGKLRFVSDPDGKHESFSIPKKMSIILPSYLPINLQHGRSDVGSHIVRQIFNFLGLSYSEFLVGKKCKISAAVIYKCLLWKHFTEFFNYYCDNSAAYSAILEQYIFSGLKSLDIILAEFGSETLNPNEVAILDRISFQAKQMASTTDDWDTAFKGGARIFTEKLLASFQKDG